MHCGWYNDKDVIKETSSPPIATPNSWRSKTNIEIERTSNNRSTSQGDKDSKYHWNSRWGQAAKTEKKEEVLLKNWELFSEEWLAFA